MSKLSPTELAKKALFSQRKQSAAQWVSWVEDKDGYMVMFSGAVSQQAAKKFLNTQKIEDLIDAGGETTFQRADLAKRDLSSGSSKWTSKLPGADRKKLDAFLKGAKKASTEKEAGSHLTQWVKDMKPVLIGPGIRVRAESPYAISLEEIPQKPLKRRKMRILFSTVHTPHLPHFSHLLSVNVLKDAKIGKNDSFDQAEKKLRAAIAKAEEAITKDWESDTTNPRIKGKTPDPWFPNISMGDVNYLEVVPTDAKPVKVSGKDFAGNVTWGGFKFYSPNSDLQQSDPHYSYYEPKSAAAARRMYKLVKANPEALKGIKWNDLDKWFAKNKIAYNTQFSTWS